MKLFIIGLIIGIPIGLLGWMLKLVWEKRAKKRIEKKLDTKLSKITKSGKLPEFLDYLERETPPVPNWSMNDLYSLYREQEKRERMGKELQKWVDSL